MEENGAAAEPLQLREGGIDTPGFPDRGACALGDLVGTDDQCFRVCARYRGSLGQREARGESPRGLARQGFFIDVGRRGFERQREAREHFFSIRAGRSQDNF